MIPARAGLCSVVVLMLLAGCGGSGRNGDGDGDGEVELVAPGEAFLATLCFPSALGLLRCDQRPIRAADSVEETAAVIVEALIAGPGEAGAVVTVSGDADDAGEPPEPNEELLPALPAGVRLLAVELLDGVAYVDLTTVEVASRTGAAGTTGRSAVGLERPAMGLTEELLAVYSLVNSLTANNLGVDRVVLMWNGEQRPTFAGHVDTARPLMADLSRNAAPAGGI